MDREFNPGMHPAGHEDIRLESGAISTARVALYNWLHGIQAG
jgi:hypothetical protein